MTSGLHPGLGTSEHLESPLVRFGIDPSNGRSLEQTESDMASALKVKVA